MTETSTYRPEKPRPKNAIFGIVYVLAFMFVMAVVAAALALAALLISFATGIDYPQSIALTVAGVLVITIGARLGVRK